MGGSELRERQAGVPPVRIMSVCGLISETGELRCFSNLLPARGLRLAAAYAVSDEQLSLVVEALEHVPSAHAGELLLLAWNARRVAAIGLRKVAAWSVRERTAEALEGLGALLFSVDSAVDYGIDGHRQEGKGRVRSAAMLVRCVPVDRRPAAGAAATVSGLKLAAGTSGRTRARSGTLADMDAELNVIGPDEGPTATEAANPEAAALGARPADLAADQRHAGARDVFSRLTTTSRRPVSSANAAACAALEDATRMRKARFAPVLWPALLACPFVSSSAPLPHPPSSHGTLR